MKLSDALRARLAVGVLACTLACLSVWPVAEAGAAGELDPSFGTGGRIALGSFATKARLGALAVDSRGRAVVADEPDGLAVRRFTVRGRVDRSFGRRGRAVLAGRKFAVATAVTVDAGGRVVVAGGLGGRGATGLAVARLNPDGSPDLSFGTRGVAVLRPPQADAEEVVLRVMVTPDGVLVLGSHLTLARLTNTGSPDPRFGTGGYLRLPVPPVTPPSFNDSEDTTLVGAFSVDLLARPEGRVLVLSQNVYAAIHGGHADPLLSLVSPTGVVLERVTPPAYTLNLVSALLPSPGTGFAAVGGFTDPYGGGPTFAVLGRYGVDGKPVPSFGGGHPINVSLPQVTFEGMTGLLAEHRYTVATVSGLLRFSENGRRDKSYGACGIAQIGSALSVAAPGRSRVLALTQANFPLNSLQARTSLVAVRAHGSTDPHARPVFGPEDPYPELNVFSLNPNLRSVQRRRPIVVHVETSQYSSMTVTLRTKSTIPGLPRVLARAGARTEPCRNLRVTLQADRGVRRLIGSLRRKLKRDRRGPSSVDLRIQIVLHNRAGTGRFVIKESSLSLVS